MSIIFDLFWSFFLLLDAQLETRMLLSLLLWYSKYLRFSNQVVDNEFSKLSYIDADNIDIKSTCLILCRSPLCHQNCSELLRHGLYKTSEDVISGANMLRVDTLNPVKSKVGSPWIRRVHPAQEAWSGWDLGKIAHFELIFLKWFLNNFLHCGRTHYAAE